MRILRAVTELIEAKAALLREEAATLQLGTYARGYEEGRADIMETYGFEVAYIASDDEDDE